MKSKLGASLVLVAALCAAACGGSSAPSEPSDNTTPSEKNGLLRSGKPRDTSPVASASELASLTQGDRAFAFELYRELRAHETGNFFYSPHSISSALAMTFAGARNETERELAEALDFTLGQARLHPTLNALDLALMSRGKGAKGRDGAGFQLSVANAVWPQRGMPVATDFLDVLGVNYDAGVRPLDFAAPDAACSVINGWVKDQTQGKIPELLEPDALRGVSLVLTNAIYFSAQWASVFDAKYTADGLFECLDGRKVSVPMMTQSETFRSAAGEGYRAASLPYDGGALDMVLVVPDAGRFAEVEAKLDGGSVSTILAGLDASSEQSSVRLPKWSVESEFSLADALKALGMPSAFGPSADFSGITGGAGDLWIGDVIHKAVVSVDEYGTEAAAATAVMMAGGIPTVLSVDRPFVYLIRDVQTGAVLFVGRVVEL